MDARLKDRLRKCSKDDVSFAQLEELFDGLLSKYRKVSNQLKLLEKTIQHDYDAIIITDLGLLEPGPKIVYVNDSFCKMTGYSKEEVIGKTPRILQGPKTSRSVLDRMKQGINAGEGFFGHTVNYKKDGSEFINQWDIHPLINDNGEITHWVSYQRDITEREDISKKLHTASTEFTILENKLGSTYIEIDIKGNIVSSSRSFREITGYSSDDLNQLKIEDLVAEQDRAEVEILSRTILILESQEQTHSWHFKCKKGNSILLESAFKVFEKNDELRARVTFKNLSLRKKLLEKLEKKTQKFEEALNKCEEFTLKFKKEDDNFLCFYASDNFEKITGFSTNAILNKGVEIMLSQHCVHNVNSHLNQAFNGYFTTVNCVYKTKDGDTVPVMKAFRPIWNKERTKVEAVKSVAILTPKK